MHIITQSSVNTALKLWFEYPNVPIQRRSETGSVSSHSAFSVGASNIDFAWWACDDTGRECWVWVQNCSHMGWFRASAGQHLHVFDIEVGFQAGIEVGFGFVVDIEVDFFAFPVPNFSKHFRGILRNHLLTCTLPPRRLFPPA